MMGTPAALGFYEVLILIAFFIFLFAVMFGALILILRRRQSKAVKFEAIHVSELIKLIISSRLLCHRVYHSGVPGVAKPDYRSANQIRLAVGGEQRF